MEQWRRIIEDQKDSEEIGIIDTEVTGIRGTYDSPDGLFYTEFSEEEAKAYHAIFQKFTELYPINSRIAISALEDDINEQNNAIDGAFNPLELILFSSRYAGNLLVDDNKVYKKIKSIIARLLGNDSAKIAQYILGGWEWKTQLSIFIEAIGISAPELVDLAMKYYPQMAQLCVDDDKSLLKSYVNMLISTQDESFAGYFADVVTNREYMNDAEAVDYFCSSIRRDVYWKDEKIAKQLFEELEDRNLTFIVRKKIEDLKRQLIRNNSSEITSVHDILNSKSADYLAKTEAAKRLTFSSSSLSDLHQWELIRDPDGCVLADRQGMDNIDNIYPEELRGRAYVTLGTHGKHHRDEVLEFLQEQKCDNPLFAVSINIALFDLRAISAEELFDSLFHTQYRAFYGKNLGKYFRFNKTALVNEFNSYIIRFFKENHSDETSIANAFGILYDVLNCYNANDCKLSDETLAVPDKIIEIFKRIDFNFRSSLTYDAILNIFELLSNVSSSNRVEILEMLDRMKKAVDTLGNMPSIVHRVDSMIKKLDGIAAPSGR